MKLQTINLNIIKPCRYFRNISSALNQEYYRGSIKYSCFNSQKSVSNSFASNSFVSNFYFYKVNFRFCINYAYRELFSSLLMAVVCLSAPGSNWLYFFLNYSYNEKLIIVWPCIAVKLIKRSKLFFIIS